MGMAATVAVTGAWGGWGVSVAVIAEVTAGTGVAWVAATPSANRVAATRSASPVAMR